MATPLRRSSRIQSPPSAPRYDQSKRSLAGSSSGKKRQKKSYREFVPQLGDYSVGDDVYVRRVVEDAAEESDEELEACKMCGVPGGSVMVECDGCLGGYHLSCLDPPLEEVPPGEWLCSACLQPEVAAALQQGNALNKRRTARERLLAGELWAARINKLWKQSDGACWFSGTWYIIPDETALGRQPHNGGREIFRTNHVDENEVESILRRCSVMGREEFTSAVNEGDDVFLCEYEYDVLQNTFKRIVDMEANCISEVSDGEAEEQRTPKRRQNSARKPKNKKHTSVTLADETPVEATDSQQPSTAIQRAKLALALSSVPGRLPCREKERKEIETFIAEALGKGTDCLGKCLYISGVPGTGKTATVLEVMRCIERRVTNGELQPYRFVEINGLRLTSPEQTYTMLHESLTGERLVWKRALHFLDERFSQSKVPKGFDARPCILLVDELDLLVTRTQSVLYNLFDWPCRPYSRLTVIGIANTMDLPERLLPRIASRMGLQRISFNPYSHSQLQEILSSRLSGIDAFETPAVEFASRKVAAISGDARRALELCRRAAEIAEGRQVSEKDEGEKPTLIGMGDIEAAISEMFQAPHVQVMRRCSKQSQVFLAAMVYEQNKTGIAETTFEKVAEAHSFLCSKNDESCPDQDTLLAIGCRLGECKLLLCEPGSKHRLQKMQLNFPSDDVSFALKDNPELPWVAKYLSST